MAKLPPLARTVAVGSTFYRAGDTPPLYHARKITNPKNWQGGKVPDFDGFEDGDHTAAGTSNGDAANARRTGLPGFGEDGKPKQIVRPVTGSEGAGSGKDDEPGAGEGDEPEPGAGEVEGQGDETGAGTGGGAGDGEQTPADGATGTPPAKATARARKAATQG